MMIRNLLVLFVVFSGIAVDARAENTFEENLAAFVKISQEKDNSSKANRLGEVVFDISSQVIDESKSDIGLYVSRVKKIESLLSVAPESTSYLLVATQDYWNVAFESELSSSTVAHQRGVYDKYFSIGSWVGVLTPLVVKKYFGIFRFYVYPVAIHYGTTVAANAHVRAWPFPANIPPAPAFIVDIGDAGGMIETEFGENSARYMATLLMGTLSGGFFAERVMDKALQHWLPKSPSQAKACSAFERVYFVGKFANKIVTSLKGVSKGDVFVRFPSRMLAYLGGYWVGSELATHVYDTDRQRAFRSEYLGSQTTFLTDRSPLSSARVVQETKRLHDVIVARRLVGIFNETENGGVADMSLSSVEQERRQRFDRLFAEYRETFSKVVDGARARALCEQILASVKTSDLEDEGLVVLRSAALMRNAESNLAGLDTLLNEIYLKHRLVALRK